MKYERPNITLISIEVELLQYSQMGPGATDIGAPTFSDDAKRHSIWDDDSETHYNNTKEEQENEDWN